MPQVHLRSERGLQVIPTLTEALGAAPGERLLFMCPHDDDANIGAGMTIALAAAEGFEVHIGIVTDGRQGYCSLDEQADIVEIRRREALAAYHELGVPEANIHLLGFADGTIFQYIGRRPAAPGEPAIAGFTGLENSFTHLLRSVAPHRVFTPAGTDLHPDHQAVHKDLLISIYHANGDIWPELGQPCAIPEVYEYPTYVTMSAPPDLMIEGDEALLESKLASVRCYQSQRQIEALVSSLRDADPMEFLRNIRFELYHPAVYRGLFKEAV